ncbi:WSC protein [Glarea lozoyensis ATCC 20868]|uniref:WSC protein n=1 Tax=Glarea lozoyensis (strain ATCC 20868 / MF5171) TaxID=1116229 RepID=S3DDJ0_GLAL2|nr:WSC protein [Glarea lozoyensis ATCC 20868]EPE36497.1 WSC protein [Glarea lozoyensis ATCC 20868]
MILSIPTTALSTLLLGLMLATSSIGDVEPNLPHDPKTTPYCTFWADVGSDIPCADFLTYWEVALVAFVRWNPSITSTCGNFGNHTSYCIDAYNEPGALYSPWKNLGCYVDNSNSRVLSKRLGTEAGDQQLTQKLCQALCSNGYWSYCGLENGQECWGADELNALSAEDSPISLCNMPCKGNASEMCGGSDHINVFHLTIWSSSSTIMSATKPSTTKTSSVTVPKTTAEAATTTSAVPSVSPAIQSAATRLLGLPGRSGAYGGISIATL